LTPVKAAPPPAPAEPPGRLVPLAQLPGGHPACQYVRGRGYDPADLYARYKVCFCPEARPRLPLVTGRLVIPVFRGGRPAGWQARCLGRPPGKHVPKYFTAPGMARGQLLYNFDVARRHAYVVVVEGACDAWRYGPEAVALLGNRASHVQAQLLLSGW